MEKSIIELENGDAIGYYIDLHNAPLIIIKAKKGYITCGYLSMDAANKLGDIAGKVTGVNNFDDILNGTIIEVSVKARKKGFKPGLTGRQFLNKLIDS